MGTRSLTRIIPRQEGLSYSDGHTRGELALVNAYQQYDGYPESMAVQYAEWLEGISVGNGLSGEPRLHAYANTAGCFAAQFIAKFKDAPGNFYLHKIDNELGWVEYIYTLYPKVGHDTYMSIYHVPSRSVIFVGKPAKALEQYKTNTK
tara:strand:+ start:431 stop:874 length:444 start_codon:yes stop_codon:yes gene_type:complete